MHNALTRSTRGLAFVMVVMLGMSLATPAFALDSISIAKSASVDGVAGNGSAAGPVPVRVGDTIDYTLEVTNTGDPLVAFAGGLLARGEKVVALGAGYYHSAALTSTGNVYTWGQNSVGQLGLGDNNLRTTPTRIERFNPQSTSFVLAPDDRVASLWVGYDHMGVVTAQGDVYLWGNNSNGQLGINSTGNQNAPFKNPYLSVSGATPMLAAGDVVTSLGLGMISSNALTANGEVYMWGSNGNGQLGMGDYTQRLIPALNQRLSASGSMRILQPGEVVTILRSGSIFAAALTSQQDLYVWGSNSYGEIGMGAVGSQNIPRKNEYISRSGTMRILQPNEVVEGLWLGAYHVVTLTSQQDVYVFGYNGGGTLGLNDTSHRNIPVKNPYISASGTSLILQPGETILTFDEGGDLSMSLTTDRNVYVWGYNSHGQLGMGSTSNILVPTKNPSLSTVSATTLMKSGEHTIDVWSNYYHSLALTSLGRVFSFGQNTSGQLGLGMTSSQQPLPQLVTALLGPEFFAVTDMVPAGLAVVMDGTDPAFSITDGNGDPINVGTVTVACVPQVDGSTLLAFTFTALPTGTVRISFSATVAEFGLFVNTADFFEPNSNETVSSDSTYHEASDDDSIDITAYKVLEGPWTGGELQFDFTAVQVEGLGSDVVVGSLTGSGSWVGTDSDTPFDVTIDGLNPVGSPYFFKITEDGAGGSAGGWTYSDNAYWVEVVVTSNGDTTSTATVVDEYGNNTFVNVYSFSPPQPPKPPVEPEIPYMGDGVSLMMPLALLGLGLVIERYRRFVR